MLYVHCTVQDRAVPVVYIEIGENRESTRAGQNDKKSWLDLKMAATFIPL